MDIYLKTRSSQRVLLIPELLSRIFGYSSNGSNAVNAQVCRFWCDAVTPILWHDIESASQLKALLQLLGPWSLNVPEPMYQNFKDFPSRPDWKKFLDRASLVRALTYESHMEFLHALHFISDVRPVPNMFPNLHTLTCKWSRESSSFSSYSIFVHAGLKNLYFEFNYSSHKFSPKFIPFTMPLMHLHGLRRFHIEVPDHASEVQNLRDTVIALRELPYLETLLLPLYAASAEILGTVSELPVLEEFLSGEHGRVTICGCRNKVLSPTFKVGCFPVLRCLTIAGCVAELVAIIQHPYFPVTIDYLTVDHKNCTQGGNNLTLFHESLVDKCHKLEEYSLLSSLDGPPLPFGEIRPLFALKLLRCLEIEGRVPLTFTSDEIQELGLSLPELETLRLTQRPLSLGSIPAVAIETLQAIAQFCPKLKTLGLSMDTSNVSTENIFRIKPFNSSLCELNIGQSRLPIENLGKTALYLAQVLPPECEITIDSELYSDDDEDMRAWTALNKLLPDLRKVKDLGQ